MAGASAVAGRVVAVTRGAAELGAGAIGLELDVTDRGSFERFLDAAADRLGPVDVLVNNAGVMVVGPFAEANEAAAARVMDVNVGGVIHGMRLAIPRLRGPRGGPIVEPVPRAGLGA